jgi:hypothetical protein
VDALEAEDFVGVVMPYLVGLLDPPVGELGEGVADRPEVEPRFAVDVVEDAVTPKGDRARDVPERVRPLPRVRPLVLVPEVLYEVVNPPQLLVG